MQKDDFEEFLKFVIVDETLVLLLIVSSSSLFNPFIFGLMFTPLCGMLEPIVYFRPYFGVEI